MTDLKKNVNDFNSLIGEILDTHNLHINVAGVDYKAPASKVLKKSNIASDLNSASESKVISQKLGNDLQNIDNWLNKANGILFTFNSIWDITRLGSNLTITMPSGYLIDINSSAKIAIPAGAAQTITDGGGIVLNKAGSSISFDYLNDISTITEGASITKFVIAKNIGGILRTRYTSIEKYLYTDATSIVDLSWDFDTSVNDADPGSGEFRMNNIDPSLVTELYFSKISKQGIPVETTLLNIDVGDPIQIFQISNSVRYIIGTAGVVVDNTNHVTVPVVIVSSGSIFNVGEECQTSLYDEIDTPLEHNNLSNLQLAGAGVPWGHVDETLYNQILSSGHVYKENGTAINVRAARNVITNAFTGLSWFADDPTNNESDEIPQLFLLNDVDPTGKQAGDLLQVNSTNNGVEPVATATFDNLQNTTEANITADGQLSTIVPAGYQIDTIIIKETSGNTAGNISIGTVALGAQIVSLFNIPASTDTKAPLTDSNGIYISSVNDTDLYISSSAWGSGVVQVYFTFKKVI